MKIKDIMTRSVVTITPDESAALAARLLARHGLGSLPVCGYDGTLRGIVTDRDIIVRCVAAGQDPTRVPVRDIMSVNVDTIAPEDELETAARHMARSQVRRLPVSQTGQIVGIISLGDLAKCRYCDMEAAAALSEISENIKRRKH